VSEVREFVVTGEEAGTRLDLFLSRRLPEWSRSQIQRQIRSGFVSVGPGAVYKTAEAVRSGDRVSIRASTRELRAVAEALPLDILYEDDDLLVVNKAAGMVVHLGAGVKSGTLVNAFLHHISSLSAEGGDLRPGIVHRLDRMTSGVIIVAKNDVAHRGLTTEFKERRVHKSYIALVHGRVANDRGEVRASIGRDPVHRVRMKTGGIGARQASTQYCVLRRFGKFTLLNADPLTGRTHQIRVHLASIGHPVVGDTLYGAPSRIHVGNSERKTLARNFLHAARIEFSHPRSGEMMRFDAPLPRELEEFLDLAHQFGT
jgi:23S rRNA pseudouridine1911/1915/1917 synthase